MSFAINSKINLLKSNQSFFSHQRKWEKKSTVLIEIFPNFLNHVISHLKKPKSEAEYIVYLCLFCLALNSLGVGADQPPAVRDLTKKNFKQNPHNIVPIYPVSAFPNAVDPYKDTANEGGSYYVSDEEWPAENQSLEKNVLHSLLNHNPSLVANKCKASNLLSRLSEMNAQKLNWPTGAYLDVSEKKLTMKVPQGIDKIPEERERQQKLDSFFQRRNAHLAILKEDFKKEINPDLAFLRKYPKSERDEILTELNNIANYVFEVRKQFMQARLVEEFQGGNCEGLSSFAVAQALRTGTPIELITIWDEKKNSHLFTVIGRTKHSLLDDVFTWGENCIIIDYWAHYKNGDNLNNGVITIEQIKQVPGKYAIYLKRWHWKAQLFLPKLPQNLKGNHFSKVKEIRDFYSICQNKLKDILSTYTLNV